MNVALVVIGGARPVPDYETDLSFGRRLSVCGRFVKRLRGGAWGRVGREAGGKALAQSTEYFRR